MPKVASLAYPGLSLHLDKQDWYFKLPNGSEIWLLGLDDKERTEKVLGMEFATIAFNECSELSWGSVEMALTRLAQNCLKSDGRELRLVAYFDCNPPGKAHWTYRYFVLKINPESRQPLNEPERVAWLQMNPNDNRENLPDSYFRTLEGLSGAKRKRFLRGDFADDIDGALWTADGIDARRLFDLPELSRIVVAVDPSGASGPEDYRSDEIGIVCAGMIAGKPFDKPEIIVLDDATLRGSPAQWARKAVATHDLWDADAIVGETNYGGAMVGATIKNERQNLRYIEVRASRGKHVRAEPVAGLFEDGRLWFGGEFEELEDQLCGFLTSGYIGERSPDRADSMIWAVTELLGGTSSYTLENL